MAFLDEIDEIREKAFIGTVPRRILVGVALVGLVAAAIAFSGITAPAGGGFTVEKDSSSPSAATNEASSEASVSTGSEKAGIFVYVVGCVSAPGVYELAQGSRVNDAVQAAGGLAEDADAASVNLARVVADGEQVLIPALAPAGSESQDDGVLANGMSRSAAAQSAGATSAVPSGIRSDGLVNINIATQEELETLKGIGPSTARKIIESREAEGPFASKEDVKRVSGIGDKKYAAIADSIIV